MSGLFGIGGSSASTGFYPYLLERSLRFSDDSGSRLKFLPDSAGTSNTDWTISFWIKRNSLGTTQDIIDVGAGDGTGSSGSSDTNTDTIQFQSDDTIRIQRDGSQILHTNAKFRDTSAWYNIVVKSDADNGTAADKLKVYINGLDQDDSAAGGGGFSVDNRSGLSNWTEIGSSDPIQIGARIYNNGNNLDAYLAEFHYVDGTALTASSFGETKEGIWIPKQYTGSHGTNGFYLNFTDDTTAAGFSTVTFTGTGAAQSLIGVGFQPDFVWLKDRTGSSDHVLYDSLRGVNAGLVSNSTAAENTASSSTQDFVSFDSDGFSVGIPTQFGSTGSTGKNIVAWNWEAGGAPSADNSAGQGNVPTAGSVKIDGSNSSSALSGTLVAKRISANTTYGFSIITFNSGSTDNVTLDHGLGAVPKWIITRPRDNSGSWVVYHAEQATDPSTGYLVLDDDALFEDDVRIWNDTMPTSDHVTLGNVSFTFGDNKECIMYCWSEISGYSKFGGYTGNGSSGHAITTGFAPAWLMVKRVDPTGSDNSWYIVDNTRTANTASGNDDLLYANLTNEEGSTNDFFTFTSTGFELNTNSPAVNTNGGEYIYMAFKDTRTNAFFRDQSGNGNHFSPLGLEYTDSMLDLPTNNWCVLNSNLGSFDTQITYQAGNIEFDQAASAGNAANMNTQSTFGVSSGKWYWEVFASSNQQLGFSTGMEEGNHFPSVNGRYNTDGSFVASGCTAPSSGASRSSTDVIGFAFDADNGTLAAYKNNSLQGTFTSIPTRNEYFARTFVNSSSASGGATFNFGQDSSFGGRKIAGGNTDANGIGDFFYAPPSGFLALCTNNLPNPGVDPDRGDDPADYFNTVLYTGDGSTSRGITGVGFSPDFTWIKDRSNANNHVLVDRVRGVSELLYTNSNIAAVTGASQVSSFDSDGFTIGATTYVNENTSSNIYVAWNWKAGGTAVSNGDGSITSSVSASPESGFSIVSYTGTGSAATVGHGLGKVPAWIIIKNRGTGSREWLIYHHQSEGVPQNFGMFFGSSPSVAPFDDDSAFNDTAPTTTVFSVKNSASSNNAGEGHIAYCFAEIEGFSKFGRYAGEGGADNSFVYLGFRPAWFLLKRVNSTGDWVLYDNRRDPFNVGSTRVSANLSGAEIAGASNYGIDFLSNGVKFRSGQADTAVSGGTYIYMAFAEQPFKYANAR